jgi:GNAT superfamily N-acetyltransferase
LNIQVHDAQGQWVGGILAATYWNWLVIDVLALVDEVRGRGIGTQLMARVEAEARARGCTRAHTSTYAHQALGFYQRRGYRIVGQMEDYPEGFTYYWLEKELSLRTERLLTGNSKP